jgi:hypothetical protein
MTPHTYKKGNLGDYCMCGKPHLDESHTTTNDTPQTEQNEPQTKTNWKLRFKERFVHMDDGRWLIKEWGAEPSEADFWDFIEEVLDEQRTEIAAKLTHQLVREDGDFTDGEIEEWETVTLIEVHTAIQSLLKGEAE